MPHDSTCRGCSTDGHVLILVIGDKSDMSNYRGITVGPVIAKLFAMILEQRIASWAEDHAVKAKGQAGFRKNSARLTISSY